MKTIVYNEYYAKQAYMNYLATYGDGFFGRLGQFGDVLCNTHFLYADQHITIWQGLEVMGCSVGVPNIGNAGTSRFYICSAAGKSIKWISIQKQGRHDADWAPGMDVDALLDEAYQYGIPFKGRPDSLMYETGRVIGAKGETQIIIREAKYDVHGHPAAKVLK